MPISISRIAGWGSLIISGRGFWIPTAPPRVMMVAPTPGPAMSPPTMTFSPSRVIAFTAGVADVEGLSDAAADFFFGAPAEEVHVDAAEEGDV